MQEKEYFNPFSSTRYKYVTEREKHQNRRTVISSHSHLNKQHVRFTTVPFKPL